VMLSNVSINKADYSNIDNCRTFSDIQNTRNWLISPGLTKALSFSKSCEDAFCAEYACRLQKYGIHRYEFHGD